MAGTSRQGGRGKPRFRNQQAARCFPIEPVHQPRLLALDVAHHFQHVVDIARDTGAALHRQPLRLVQHHDVGILEQDHVLERLQCLLRGFGEASGRGLRRIEPQRRNAHALSLLQPVLAVGALAIDAQLAFADDALDVGERQPWKACLEEAVDPHVVSSAVDHGLDLGRQRRRFGNYLLRLRDERFWRTRR
jgi:hypothetical protein